MLLESDHMRIDPAYRAALKACGLDTVQRVIERIDGAVAAWSRSTETLHIPAPDGGVGFYVKRYYYASWSRRLRCALRGTLLGRHRALAEYRLLRDMRRLGLPAVRPVACGTRRLGRFVVVSFLITEEVPGARNLTALANDIQSGRVVLTPTRRRELIRSLARQVAELHAACFVHGQLFWRNLLVRFDIAGRPEFFFLDVRPRHGGRRRSYRRRWWLRELAHLAASAIPFCTLADRLRFMHEYYGARALTPHLKRDMREIDRLARHWLEHERKRIHMNALFEDWNRQLRGETARHPDADLWNLRDREPRS